MISKIVIKEVILADMLFNSGHSQRKFKTNETEICYSSEFMRDFEPVSKVS